MSSTLAKFMWIIARVDSRQYRQNSTELQPENFWVGVEIPMNAEYVWNADEILKVREVKATSELGFDSLPIPEEPQPIYTNKAIEFCLEYLGKYLRDPEPQDFKQEDNEDWGDTSTEPTTTEIENGWSDSADWSDKGTTVSNPAQEDDWGASDTNPAGESEIWDDTEEDWTK